MAQEDLDKILELARAERRVATPGGAKRFKQAIGAIIRRDPTAQPTRTAAAPAPNRPKSRDEQTLTERMQGSFETTRVADLDFWPTGTQVRGKDSGISFEKTQRGTWRPSVGAGELGAKEIVGAETLVLVRKGMLGTDEGKATESDYAQVLAWKQAGGSLTPDKVTGLIGNALEGIRDGRLGGKEALDRYTEVRAKVFGYGYERLSAAQRRGLSLLDETATSKLPVDSWRVDLTKAPRSSEMRPAPKAGQAVTDFDQLDALPVGSRVADPWGKVAFVKEEQGWRDEKSGESGLTPPDIALFDTGDLGIRRVGPEAEPAEGSKGAGASSGGGWIQNKDVTYKGKTFTVLKVLSESRRNASGLPDPNGSMIRASVKYPHMSGPIMATLPVSLVDGGGWAENEDVTYKGKTYKVLKVMPESRRTQGGMPDPNGPMVRVTVQEPHLSKPTTITLPVSVVQKKVALSAESLDETSTLLLSRDEGILDGDVEDFSRYLSVAQGMGYTIR